MLANHQGPNVHNENLFVANCNVTKYRIRDTKNCQIVVLAFRILVSKHIFMAVVL